MPTLIVTLASSEIDANTGKIPINLHHNIKAQEVMLRKVTVLKNAASTAGESRVHIEIPELFHECFAAGSKHACFCVPTHHSDHFEEHQFGSGLKFGIENLNNIIHARVYNTDDTLILGNATSGTDNNKINFKEILLYIDYNTNDLF